MSAQATDSELTPVSLQDGDGEPRLNSAGLPSTTSLPRGQDGNAGTQDPDPSEESRLKPSGGREHSGEAGEEAGPGEAVGQCVDHESELNWFCITEGKRVCSQCPIVGSCRGHSVSPVERRAAAVRDRLVDVCEKLQLQAQRIERFLSDTLSTREHGLQVAASSAREQCVRWGAGVRGAVEEAEQWVLEAVQREDERVRNSLLTQRAHWAQGLGRLGTLRAELVRLLTETTDSQLVSSSQEMSERVEQAEGVGEPHDSDKLTFDLRCCESPLLMSMWVSATILSHPAENSLCFDEGTVSPLLSLSDDGRCLTFLPRRQRQPRLYNPGRFDSWPNALCGRALASGLHRWTLSLEGSQAFKVGVCYGSMERKGSGNAARLGYNTGSWVLSYYESKFCFSHAGRHLALPVLCRPKWLAVLLDFQGGTLVFADRESGAVLHAHHQAFSEALYPACAVAHQSLHLLSH
ncbi:B box and SPRY domain-containing protein [Amia ocellicauda]|uniref:B box and SPRY domain-containing protein n=1 Tax=Amia ocellicauda TaxID=2972642 RepID=UPI003464CA67